MYWTILLIAGLLEIAWAVGLKYADGFSKPLPSIITIALMAASFYLLSLAMRGLSLGSAYAVWTGIGAIGSVIAGIALFHEPASAPRLLCIGLILAGIVGLRLTSPH